MEEPNDSHSNVAKRGTLKKMHTADNSPSLPRAYLGTRRASCRPGFDVDARHTIYQRVRKQSSTVSDLVSGSSRRFSIASDGHLSTLHEAALRSEPIAIADRLTKEQSHGSGSLHPSPKAESVFSSSAESAKDDFRLQYDEMLPRSTEEIRKTWKTLLNHPKREIAIFDIDYLIDSVQSGVSRDLRAKVWHFLAEQCQRRNIQNGYTFAPVPKHDYDHLLAQPSPYDQVILVDINRTFPSHPYFSEQFGKGQINLFNVLKAYSVLDPEVGYCQGLSFVASILLLHADERDAFGLLAKLMYNMGLRKQYLPDMLTLQVQLYQLTRSLNVQHPDLYEHFESNDIPSIFSAPWFLTLFASTFPTGFAVRVMDVIFLVGKLDVVFNICLTLLGGHKELIKHCCDFDAINDFLRTDLPNMSIIQMERIIGEIFELDIERELLGYAVEYEILQAEEAMSPTNALPAEQVSRLRAVNRNLRHHNKDLLERLKSTQLELGKSREREHSLENKLRSGEAYTESLKMQVASLTKRLSTYEFEYKALLNAIGGKSGSASPPDERVGSPDGACSSDSGFHDRP